jgi:hypothetical protein
LFMPNLINMNVHSAICSWSVELYKQWYTLADFCFLNSGTLIVTSSSVVFSEYTVYTLFRFTFSWKTLRDLQIEQ